MREHTVLVIHAISHHTHLVYFHSVYLQISYTNIRK